MDTFFYFYTGFKEITDFFSLIILIFLAEMTKKGFHIIFIFSCKISWLGNCKSLRKTRRKSLHYQICISYFNYIKFDCNIAILKWNTLLNVEIYKFWLFALFWKCPTKTFYTGIFFLKSQYTFSIFLKYIMIFDINFQ
jgi:hypothetical protein